MGTFLLKRKIFYWLESTIRSSDLNHSTNELVVTVAPPPGGGVAVAVGVSVNVPTAVIVAVAVSVANGVPVVVAVAVAVSVANCVPVDVAVKFPSGVFVGNGVADPSMSFQPLGTCGWITMPTAVSFPFPRLAGAIMVTKEPTASMSARPGGRILSEEESKYWCCIPD
jgi:hypothetical protein